MVRFWAKKTFGPLSLALLFINHMYYTWGGPYGPNFGFQSNRTIKNKICPFWNYFKKIVWYFNNRIFVSDYCVFPDDWAKNWTNLFFLVIEGRCLSNIFLILERRIIEVLFVHRFSTATFAVRHIPKVMNISIKILVDMLR